MRPLSRKALTTHLSFLTAFMLASCAPQSSLIEDAIQTASGRITEVKDRVDKAVQPLVETVETVNKRVKQVQSGAQLIQEGIETVQEGIGQ